jgi:hypothetical protein
VKSDINPKFAQFALHFFGIVQTAPDPDEELLNYYQDIIDIVKESQQIDSAIYTLGLPPHNFMEAIRLIVQSAAKYDLLVMYGHPETVFLLNGQTLPSDHAEMWQAAWEHMDEESNFPKNLKEFKKYTESRIAELAEKHGFVKSKHPAPHYSFEETAKGYIKEVPFGQQFFYMNYEGGRGEYRLSMNLYCLNTDYARIFKGFNFKRGGAILSTSLSSYKGFQMNSQGPRICNLDELNTILSMIEQKIFVLYDRLQTIADIDMLVNGSLSDMLQGSIMPPHNVIIARLVGNPRFEELVEQTNNLPAMKWGVDREAYLTEWPKLLKYLSEEVKPII